MSGIIVLVQREKKSVHIITDGAAIDDDDRLESFVAKVSMNPALNLAASARGKLPVAMAVTKLVTMSYELDFDEWKAAILARLQTLLAGAAPHWQNLGPDGSYFELVCVGLSAGGPNAFVISNIPGRPDLPQMQIVEIELAYAAPDNADADAGILDYFSNDLQHEFNALIMARLLIMKQREMKPRDLQGRDRHIVGAYAQMTSIQPGAITTKIIHRWPEDKIGEPINSPKAELL